MFWYFISSIVDVVRSYDTSDLRSVSVPNNDFDNDIKFWVCLDKCDNFNLEAYGLSFASKYNLIEDH